MPRFTATIATQKILSTRFLPLFNYADVATCQKVIMACYNAGIQVFELTNRDSNALDVFSQLQPWVKDHCPDLCLGAGTVCDAATAKAYIAAGADFIVAPIFDQSTLNYCKEIDIPYIPGCLSPTELYHAHQSGCALVKLFPAGTVGPDYVKNVLAPMPGLQIIATGGVQFSEEEIKRWFSAGVKVLGIGSSVFTKGRIEKGDFGAIEEDLRKISKVLG